MRPLVLGGFAGSGKSSVGALVAARLGTRFADTDALLGERVGLSTAEAFTRLGEGAFRALERTVVDGALDAGGVVAVGGGALAARDVRHAVLERATVVTLDATVGELEARIHPGTRPLLAAPDRARRIAELLDTRRDAYAEAHFRIETTGRRPDAIAEEVASLADDDSLVVPLGRRTHRYRVVHDAPGALAGAVNRLDPSAVLVVTDTTVAQARQAYLARFAQALDKRPLATVVVAAGEANKDAAAVAAIWEAALGEGVDREGVVVAFGGGVVGDLAGFCASTALRGVRWVQAPTTSLAMVDASIGGKTGFNHATGKNRIGTICQPSAIVADLAHLDTLSSRHRTAGLVEVLKIALATDAPLLDALGNELDGRLALRAATAKIRIVRDDELEMGARLVLNLGHTVGHAIEAHTHYTRYLHGEAVALGLVAELTATTRLGLTSPEVMRIAGDALARLGLPSSVERNLLEAAFPLLLADKKRTRDRVLLPVVRAVGRWSAERVELEALRRALLD